MIVAFAGWTSVELSPCVSLLFGPHAAKSTAAVAMTLIMRRTINAALVRVT